MIPEEHHRPLKMKQCSLNRWFRPSSSYHTIHFSYVLITQVFSFTLSANMLISLYVLIIFLSDFQVKETIIN